MTAPAVNKWEKGASYPDITILPALARLLGTDLNTLLSFQEELTDKEIFLFLEHLKKVNDTDGFEAAYQAAMDKQKEYQKAEEILQSIPETTADKKWLQVTLYMEQGELAKAQKLQEEKLLLAAGEALRLVLDSLAHPWDAGKSPLYRRIRTKELKDTVFYGMQSQLLRQIQEDEAFAFLRESPEFEKIMKEYAR